MCVDDNECVESIDNCSCRRLVFFFSHLWWRCCEAPSRIIKLEYPEGDEPLVCGDQDKLVKLIGENFPAETKVAFTGSVQVYKIRVNTSREIVATISVPRDITPRDDYRVRVIDLCGGLAECDYPVKAPAPPKTPEKTKGTPTKYVGTRQAPQRARQKKRSK